MVYLYIWMVIAANGRGDGMSDAYTHVHRGWVNQGAFSREACPKAAAVLGIQPDKFRCVESGR